MKVIRDKGEMYNAIGDWTTVHIHCDYELGSNEMIVTYDGESIKYENDDVLNVAWFASQCNGITSEQYNNFYHELINEKDRLAEKDDMLIGFYSYSGFGEPELIAKDLEGFKENVLFREGYLTDSVDVTDQVKEALEEELDWIESNYGEIDVDNPEVVEDLKDFLYEYGVFLNPTKEELQEFNISRGLDKDEYIRDLFSNQKEINREFEM